MISTSTSTKSYIAMDDQVREILFSLDMESAKVEAQRSWQSGSWDTHSKIDVVIHEIITTLITDEDGVETTETETTDSQTVTVEVGLAETSSNDIANVEAAFWVASEPARMGGRKVRMHATSAEAAKLEAQIQWEEWSCEDDLAEIEILLEQVGGDADGERSWLCFEVGTTEELTLAARAAKV